MKKQRSVLVMCALLLFLYSCDGALAHGDTTDSAPYTDSQTSTSAPYGDTAEPYTETTGIPPENTAEPYTETTGIPPEGTTVADTDTDTSTETDTDTTVPPETDPPVTVAPPETSTAPPDTTVPPPDTTVPPPDTTVPLPPETTAPPPVTTAPPPPVTTATPVVTEPPKVLSATAPGLLEARNGSAVIDYSNTSDGYVMVMFTASTESRLKVQVKSPQSNTYTYNLTPGTWETFPLSEGSGSYTVTVFQNVSGTKYAAVLSKSFDTALKSQFEPFLYPNQYVNFSASSNAVKTASRITAGISDPLKKVDAIYDFVVDNITYDKVKAANVKSGYLPVLDQVLAERTGICFDYAALMTGMLRSQGVPCKLVVGYAGTEYHAWINVWTDEAGWIDGVIFFDGKKWQRMDPTFASSGKRSNNTMKFVNNDNNYTVKYLY